MAASKRKPREEQRNYDELPERIPASPENIMRALVNTPPKQENDWKYLKPSK